MLAGRAAQTAISVCAASSCGKYLIDQDKGVTMSRTLRDAPSERKIVRMRLCGQSRLDNQEAHRSNKRFNRELTNGDRCEKCHQYFDDAHHDHCGCSRPPNPEDTWDD